MRKGYRFRSDVNNPEIYKKYNVLNPVNFKALLNAYVRAHGDVRAKNQSLARRATFDDTATLYVVGDVHSGITALVGFLAWLRTEGVLETNDGQLAATARVIFLGDLVDRGVWGAEVLYVALQLWVRNPDKVFVLRGNHENHSQYERYGFEAELDAFNDDEIKPLVKEMCERLPEVLFATVRKERFVFCHGGIPHHADSSKLQAAAFFGGVDGFFNTTEGAATSNPHADSQWQWNDFDLSTDATVTSIRDGHKETTFVIGRSATAAFKAQHKVRQIVRGNGHENRNRLRLDSLEDVTITIAADKLPRNFDQLVDKADVIATSIAYPAKIPSTETPLFFVLITNKGTD